MVVIEPLVVPFELVAEQLELKAVVSVETTADKHPVCDVIGEPLLTCHEILTLLRYQPLFPFGSSGLTLGEITGGETSE